jgi:hypothetical protein
MLFLSIIVKRFYMQYTTLALGAAILLFAFYTALMSIKSPQELIKLKYMRAKMGQRAGTVVHTIAYIVVPLIFSLFILKAGIDGITITQFITGKVQ